MAQDLHLTFKAGICEASEKESSDGEPRHIKPLPGAGYIYLFTEDDLLHFCWRPRSAPMSDPELDLIMFAGDASFKPYKRHGSKYSKAHPDDNDTAGKSPTNGRLYVLSFSSSSDRHFFWLQSKSQSDNNDPSWHSPRDLKIAEIVNKLLAGEDVDAPQEIAAVTNGGGGGDGGGGDDTAMEDGDGAPHSPSHHRAASGGAGADATGGDIREEGEESREGGADGGRAAASSALAADPDAQAAISSFLQSLSQGASQSQAASQGQGPGGELFTTLPDLLSTATTIPALDSASDSTLDKLLSHLPPSLILISAGEGAEVSEGGEPDADTVAAVAMSLSAEQKRTMLRKVLRSPQFAQSLGSLTMALRDGGLPTISEALGVKVKHGGYLREQGGVPLGGGQAVRAFLEGFKEEVAKEGDEEKGTGEEMQTD